MRWFLGGDAGDVAQILLRLADDGRVVCCRPPLTGDDDGGVEGSHFVPGCGGASPMRQCTRER
jgi:hypothetical protein